METYCVFSEVVNVYARVYMYIYIIRTVLINYTIRHVTVLQINS
jgi:hypothetical protein